MRLVLPYPPSVNRMWRHYNGITVTDGAVRAYKKEVAYMARQQGAQVLHGAICVSVDIYRPRRVGDLSNRYKVLEDALIGVCYEDDEQIVDIHMRRFDCKSNPRVEVDIQEV